MTPVEQIIESLEKEPHNWNFYGNTIFNNRNRWEIWASNNVSELEIYNPKRKLTFKEKLKLNKALKKWNKVPLQDEVKK